ncbi:MAG TPA: hypothetical protein VJ998_04240, partial [Pseudomonadales bacterium]|nr:hypothetical protein [Pseudomonadales bacterium]
MLTIAAGANGSPFDDAQTAARQGRYKDVVSVLSAALSGGDLDSKDRVRALSNRGVAYSLLGSYGRASRDLHAALDIDPADNLSLNQLGLLAERIDHDNQRAFAWYAKAANAGYAPSQTNLARLYAQGLGTPRDAKK